MEAENWLKNLDKRVALGVGIFAVVGLAFLFYITDFSLIGFLWFWVGVFASGALAHFLFPVVVRQRLILSVVSVVLLALVFSFVVGSTLPLERSETLIFGAVFGWGMGSGRLFWPLQRGAGETSDTSSLRNLGMVGYTALFAVGLFVGLVLSSVLL